MKSSEFIREAFTGSSSPVGSNLRKERRNNKTTAKKKVEELAIEEGIGKSIGLGLLGAGAIAGTVGKYNDVKDHEKYAANAPAAQTQQSTQKQPNIKAPAAKKSGWESRTSKDEMSGTSESYRTLSSDDGTAHIALSSDRANILLPSRVGNVHFNSGQPTTNFRIKVDGVLLKNETFLKYGMEASDYFGAGISNKETMRSVQLGYSPEDCDLVTRKIAAAKSSIQIEVTLHGSGKTIFTFTP